MVARIAAYVRNLARRRRIASEADEELQFHVDQEVRANIQRGLDPEDARRRALSALGGMTQTAESVRDVRTLDLEWVWRDVRYGLRSLVSTPRYSAIALATLVLMIGGVTTIFTLVNAVLLRPLPYPSSDRLVSVEARAPKRFSSSIPLADFLVYRRVSHSFDGWGLYRTGYVTTIDSAPEPVPVQDMRVTPEIFSLLGIRMQVGRALLATDADAGAPDVAVIGQDLWQTRFGGAADVLSRSIAVRGKAYAIVGVTASGADVPGNWLTYPIVWRAAREATDASMEFRTLARLKPGVSIDQARAELTDIGARVAVDQGVTHTGWTITTTRLLDQIVGDYQRILWIFFGAVVCVLLIGLANLASLQLVRNGARDREIVLRAALGASRGRLVTQLLTEAIVLSVVGGAIGLAIAYPAVHVILATLPTAFPRADAIAVDSTVALFAGAVSLLSAVAFALVPAWRAARADLVGRLNEAGRSATIGIRRSRVQRMLIGVETAVALVLVIGAALLANSLERLLSRDAGMHEDRLWAIEAELPNRYRTAGASAFWTSTLSEMRRMKGVESAALAVNASAPLSGGDILEGGVIPEGAPDPPRGGGLSVSARGVSSEFFSTIGMPIVSGRAILESDGAGQDPVVVVNELTAAALWPGQNPLGKRLKTLGQLKTVVGVISTYRHARLDEEPTPQMYLSYLQQNARGYTSAVIMLRASPGATGFPAAATAVLTAMDKDVQVHGQTMADVRWQVLAAERFRTTLFLIFAASAVFLALVGVSGLIAYTIGQRRREIAVRVALGATATDVVRVVTRQAMVPSLAGFAVGLVVSISVTRLLTTFLVEIRPTDPPTYLAAVVALAIAVSLASLIPARQVLRIRPVETLRHE